MILRRQCPSRGTERPQVRGTWATRVIVQHPAISASGGRSVASLGWDPGAAKESDPLWLRWLLDFLMAVPGSERALPAACGQQWEHQRITCLASHSGDEEPGRVLRVRSASVPPTRCAEIGGTVILPGAVLLATIPLVLVSHVRYNAYGLGRRSADLAEVMER